MIAKILPLLTALLLIASCASPDGVKDRHGHIKSGDPSKISLGMSKLEVMQALGKPENVAADATGETLSYRLERPWWQDKPFEVKLQEGKVISFQVIEQPDRRN
jgi:hypothetical protein